MGPVLVTHAGLSGPAVLRLSAFGAREMHAVGHTFELKIAFAGTLPQHTLTAALKRCTTQFQNRLVASHPPPEVLELVPRRLYKRLVEWAMPDGHATHVRWGQLPAAGLERLVVSLTSLPLKVEGRSPYVPTCDLVPTERAGNC
jgi:predicted flavoprotein YhiN